MSQFALAGPRLLSVDLANEKVFALAGSMVAYTGQVKFEKSLTGGEGVLGMLKRKATGEGVQLMLTSGSGKIYFANKAQFVSILQLSGEKLMIESSTLLAYSDGLRTNTAFTGLRGAASGQGLFTTTMEGSGSVAVFSVAPLVALQVDPANPLCVDPDAYVAAKGSVQSEFIFDVNWKTVVGQSSGESYQLRFTGSGTVYITPAERR